MHKKQANEPQRRKVTQLDVTINAGFMTALSLELLLRYVEDWIRMDGARFQREAKMKFTRFLDHTKKALHFAEELTQEIYNVDADKKWKNIPVWQEESNELARLILLYADRSADVENVEAVFKLLRELPGEDIVDEKMLDYFRLKKI